MDRLGNRIEHIHHPSADAGDDHDEFQDYDEGVEIEEEEVVEEIGEQELLALLDQQQDSLEICRGLFFSQNPDGLIPSGQTLSTLSEGAAQGLYRNGLVVIDGFFTDAPTISQAHQLAADLVATGRFVEASTIRQDDDPFRDRKARDDWILWLHANDELASQPPLKPLVQKFEDLRADLGKIIRLSGETEYQYGFYRGTGGHYDRHRDSFPNDDPSDTEQRRVTAICYLNPASWEPAHGGELRIHRKGAEREIAPVGGRLVLFLSGVVDHEVCPSFQDRVAITAWYK
ncbi:2OG-Fe(II) oxygenase superfamily-domain-containing protein [Polychytrium aggregatum]|uniref:2OG-Fe(II) oxygenase superfamily-domain-containing protein n=1 Tax=Polychytrium aggregatum TaxID=110093 RepID=UPI0022FF2BAC|nr:2OG-Fe(II) oxygenase superfamily-domain-containing protein [Polychytrium aggregatum]KAI9203231.1 2OG-Fe(II) oxygenase superfamily-domain-containing protein [Polychytrium aggregatum]